jgi:hypothetical protein
MDVGLSIWADNTCFDINLPKKYHYLMQDMLMLIDDIKPGIDYSTKFGIISYTLSISNKFLNISLKDIYKRHLITKNELINFYHILVLSNYTKINIIFKKYDIILYNPIHIIKSIIIKYLYKKKLIEIKYRPGGSGYIKALNSFNNLK